MHSTEIVQVETGTGSLPVVVDEAGEPRVVIKAAVESLGLDFSAAWRRLNRRSWAVVAMTATTASDGKTYKMATVSQDTWAMFLATIDENRVAEHLRPLVIEFQRESARALRDFWIKGVAVNRHTDSKVVSEELERAREELGLHELAQEIHQVQIAAAKAEGWKQGVKAGRYSSRNDETMANPYSDEVLQLLPKYVEADEIWAIDLQEEFGNEDEDED